MPLAALLYLFLGTGALVLGYYVLQVPFGLGAESDLYRYLFAAICFLFGGYRIYSGIHSLKQYQREKNNPRRRTQPRKREFL